MIRKIIPIALSLMMAVTMTVPAVAWTDEDCYEGHHDWSEWFVEEYSTCSEPGYEKRYCFNCYQEEERWLPQEEHSWCEEVYDPTCVDDGWIYRYCSFCGEWEEETLPATDVHDWGDWSTIKAATIYKAGQKERFCDYCSEHQVAKIAKLKPFAKFAKKTYSLGKGKSMKMKVSYARGDKIKSWKSSKKKVATINKKGKIVGKKKGTTKITVTMKSGKKATCVVKVVKAAKPKAMKVYWTPLGTVYHKHKDCPTLSRSRVIKSGSIKASRKPRICKVCGYW